MILYKYGEQRGESTYVYVYITPINFRPSWLVAARQEQRCSPRKKKVARLKPDPTGYSDPPTD